MNAGDCFLAETDTGRDGEIRSHLFVVLLNPTGASRNTVTVSCATIHRSTYDTACELEPGDHEFIQSPSYVVYHRARIESEPDIERRIREKRAHWRPPVKPEILERMRQGLIDSKFTKKAVKEWYLQNRLNDLLS